MIKKDLLAIAIGLAETHGYMKITRDQIAEAAEVSQGSVTNHLGTMRQMRREIVRHGVRTRNNRIIAQAVAHNDDYVMSKLTRAERLAALSDVA